MKSFIIEKIDKILEQILLLLTERKKSVDLMK